MKTTINNTQGVVTYRDGNTIVFESPFGIEIKGDLTIAGTTTTNARVDDKLIELGYGATGSADHDAGIVVERGNDANVFFGWDESADKFVVGTGTFTGTTTANLSFSPAGTSFLSVVANSLTGSNTVTVPAGGLIIGSTAVTATAAEINAIAGGGLDSTELGYLNAVTAGTAAASKAVVLDSSKDVTGINSLTATTLAGTLSTAAQTNVTSLGTLTALTVDNIALDGATIGHTSDTDLITLADGVVTVAGEISATTLDIAGTNITSTAAELNLLDGSAKSTSSITVADDDAFLIIDGTTTKQIPASDLKTYVGATAGSTAITNLDIDGGTDIGEALADADLLIVDNGAGGTNRKTELSRIKTYVADLTLTTAAQTAITSVGTLSTLAISGDLTVDTSTLKVDSSNNAVGIGTATPNSQPDEKNDLVIGDLTGNRGMTIASAGTGVGTIRFARSASANDGEGWIDYSGNSKKMRFGTNGLNTRVTIDGSGNVGIGDGTPTEALDINSDAIRIRSSQTPASAAATGTAGMICWDANYVYVCVATNTWKRASLGTW